MRRVFNIAIILALILTSCQEEIPARLEVGQSTVSVEGFSGEAKVELIATQPWTLSVGDSWCRVIPESGNGGVAPSDLFVFCDDNETPGERSCTVTIESGGMERSFTITQEHRSLLLDRFDYEVSDSAQELEIGFWESSTAVIEIDGADRDWIRVVATKSMNRAGAILSVAQNTSHARTGTVHIRCGSQDETVRIHQGPSSIKLTDVSLYEYCLRTFDWDSDGCLSIEEALKAKQLRLTFFPGTIDDLVHFPNVESLHCGVDLSVERLDLGVFTLLKDLYLEGGHDLDLDLTHNPLLEELSLKAASLKELDLKHNPLLKKLTLDVVQSLETLDLSLAETPPTGYRRIGTLEVSNCDFLKCIDLGRDTKVESIKLNMLPGFEQLILGEQPFLSRIYTEHVTHPGTLDLSGCTALRWFYWWYGSLGGVKLPGSSVLEEFLCSWAGLPSLDISSCTSLKFLAADRDNLETVTMGLHPVLEYISLDDNKLTELDLSGAPGLESLSCYNNKLRTLDLTNNPKCRQIQCMMNPDLSTVYLLEGIDYIISYDPEITGLVYKTR